MFSLCKGGAIGSIGIEYMRVVEISAWNGGRLGNNVLQLLHAAWLAEVLDAEAIRSPRHPLLRRDTGLLFRRFPPDDPSRTDVVASGEWFRAGEVAAATGGQRSPRFDELRQLARRYAVHSRIVGLDLAPAGGGVDRGAEVDHGEGGTPSLRTDVRSGVSGSMRPPSLRLGGFQDLGGEWGMEEQEGRMGRTTRPPVFDLAVHLRGGDIFPAPGSRLRPNPHYVQQPRSMVSAVVGVEMAGMHEGGEGGEMNGDVPPFSFVGVCEDLANPVARWWVNNRKWHSEVGGDGVSALRSLCLARTLCHGYSTFAQAALLISPHIRRVYCCEHFCPSAGSAEVETRVIPLPGYIYAGTWQASAAQRELMMGYPLPVVALRAVAGGSPPILPATKLRIRCAAKGGAGTPIPPTSRRCAAKGSTGGSKDHHHPSISALSAAAAFAALPSGPTAFVPRSRDLEARRIQAKRTSDMQVAAREARFKEARRRARGSRSQHTLPTQIPPVFHGPTTSSPPPARCKLGMTDVYNSLFSASSGTPSSHAPLPATKLTMLALRQRAGGSASHR